MSRAVDDIGRMPTISYFSCENGAPRLMASLAKQERLRHVERIHAGIARARIKGTQSGKPIGRPWIDKRKEAAIRAELAKGTGILKTARLCKVGTGTVQRIKREMTRAS